MKTHRVWLLATTLALAAVSRAALADDVQDVWKVEQQQWRLETQKNSTWIDTLVHPNMRFWETGAPMPRDRASLQHWSRYDYETGTVLEYELFPISATVTGDVAVAQYHYMIARENEKKERETVTGHYTDVLIKENGKWLFIAWSGGDDPKK
jgi:hypothetical protein